MLPKPFLSVNGISSHLKVEVQDKYTSTDKFGRSMLTLLSRYGNLQNKKSVLLFLMFLI